MPVRPHTENVCVRGPHAASGLSRTRTLLSCVGAASATSSVDGYCPPAPSQYVVALPSTAFAATNCHSVDEAVAGRLFA